MDNNKNTPQANWEFHIDKLVNKIVAIGIDNTDITLKKLLVCARISGGSFAIKRLFNLGFTLLLRYIMNANTLKEIISKPFIQPHIPITINNPLSIWSILISESLEN